MPNISDTIENFILNALGEDSEIELSRNELASFFACAPSQINYVLETRFTLDRGFVKESRRGGGGSIKLCKIDMEEDSYINDLILDSIGDTLSMNRAQQILSRLRNENVISGKECYLIKAAISDDALNLSIIPKEKLRANIFKNILLSLLKEKK